MTELNGYGLREHPFSLWPSDKVTNWAGMENVRVKLEDVAKSVLTSDSGLSEFVIIHGSYGAGKTHALKYMTTMINEVERSIYNSHAIYVPKIKLGPKISFLEIYKQIMQTLGDSFIRELASKIKSSVDKEVLERGSSSQGVNIENMKSEVIEELPPNTRPMVKLLMEIQNGEDSALRFLTDGKSTAPKAGYSQPINNDYQAVEVLSDLFRTMTGQIGPSSSIYNGVHLFIDEVEDILEAKSAEQLDFWSSLRELVNRLPANFALILAFSADAALLEAMMPMGVAERTTRPNIELQALEIDEAKKFVAKQLADFRPEGYSPPQQYYPFTEESVSYLLEQTVILVPRKIFRGLRQVLDRMIKREGLQPSQEITVDMTADIMAQIGSL